MSTTVPSRARGAAGDRGGPVRARTSLRVALATAVAGAVGVAFLGVIANSGVRGWVAGLSMLSLGAAVVAGSLGVRGARRDPADQSPPANRSWRGSSRAMGLAPPLLAAAASQTWFTWGKSLAGGDIAPPEGTAWIGHLFAAWTWTGPNLGVPNASEIELPWAAMLALTHMLGVPAWMAQRIWLTLLFAAAVAAAGLLLRTVGLGPVSSCAGALVYGFNPYVVSNVGINDVYLAAMVLVAAYPTAILATARGHLSSRWGVALLAALSPLLGFTYANPPLALMVAVASLAMAPLAAWLWGKPAALRALRVLLLGGAAALLVSAYWIVPALLQTSVAATGSLGAVSSWAWTEGRANLANGLWLNTTWGWGSPIYYPYAGGYEEMPLAVARFILPFFAFSGLTASLFWVRRGRSPAMLRLALAAAAVSLALIFLGTGTNLPGSIVFDLLYSLPLGFLLREPGRFLMAAALCYALLTGIAVDCMGPILAAWIAGSWSRVQAIVVPRARLARVGTELSLTAVLLVALAPAYPLALGQVAPPQKRAAFPSIRVKFPSYWTSMADYLNSKAPPGPLLILPPDDFYQMPYAWGYYGNDGFITDLLSRKVLDPSAQGYDQVSAEVARTDAQVAEALVERRGALANRLLAVLGTPLILVRGDVLASFPGRHIIPPAALVAGLLSDPGIRFLHQTGPLELFSVVRAAAHSYAGSRRIATVNSPSPDLELLSALPAGTSLVTAPMRSGLPAVIQAPPENRWVLEAHTLTMHLPAPVGWTYRMVAVSPAGASVRRGTVTGYRAGQRYQLRITLGAQELVDGSLRSGPWQSQVGNCNDVGGENVGTAVRASVVHAAGPDGTPALRLQAATDTACEATALHWNEGSFLLSLWVRHVAGAPPRICLWESARRRCSVQTPLPEPSRSWTHEQMVVTPPPGAGTLTLFVYADSLVPGQYTVNDYADASAYPVAPLGAVALVATPSAPAPSTVELVTANSSFSGAWSARTGQHVLVNGMRNGWLVAGRRVKGLDPHYVPAPWDMLAQVISLIVGAMLVVALLIVGISRSARHGWLAGRLRRRSS